ncbi:TonB-dependent receptor [Elongatibacter sediminis]|uniref:TonB-dependent receptor n=1 Tax=Elongatibacter sediminis TaxID=3119006 RepID=A0AAW9RJV6_9GAMM
MRHTTYTYAGMVLGLLAAGSAQAQSNAGASALEEVVVTASKRGGQLIQDIPITVQAISGDRLQETGALDFNDYFRLVPGLSVNDQGPGHKTYIIRGISSSGAGTVGLYFDETIITGEFLSSEGGRQPDIRLFDMDRIEVLKGPQGTTFGSSSLSGTIRWIPNAPDLSEFSAEIGGTLSSTKNADFPSWDVDAMVNIPLVADRFALRLAATVIEKEGYIDTRFAEDVNYDDSEAVRAMLAFQATDNLLISATAMTQESKTGGRAGHMDLLIDLPASSSLNGGAAPSDHWNNTLSAEPFKDNIDLYNLKAEYSADWGTVTATGSILDRETDFFRDASAEIEIITGLTFPADGTGQTTIIQPQDRKLTQGELRFASNWDGPVQVLVGGFTQKEERHFQSAVLTTDPVTGKVTDDSIAYLDRLVDTDIDEVAFFGELTWQATDRLAITGGVRWFEFDLDEIATAVTGFPGTPGSGPGNPLSSTESDTIFKFNVGYDFTDDVLGYATFSQGYRAGGTNDQTAASLAGVSIPAGFGSDSVDNYEIGIKSTLMDSRLVFNAAAFFMDWTDIQVLRRAIAPGGLQFAYRGNGGAAEVTGLEFELTAYPTDRLQLGATFGWTDAELTQDLPVADDGMDGDALPYVPEYSFSLSGRYEFPFLTSIGGMGFIGGDLTFQDDQQNRLRPTDSTYREIDSYSVFNLRVGVDGEKWSAIAGVNNLFDEDETTAYTFNGNSQPAVGYVPPGEVRPWPRTFYLSFRRTF